MNPPYNVSRVLNRQIREIVAFDRESALVEYELQECNEQSKEYRFGGVLIPPTDNDLKLFDEGEIRAGTMVCYVSAPRVLYFQDMMNPNSSIKQTYVRNGKDLYRVMGQSDRTVDGLYTKYLLVRVIERIKAGESNEQI